MASEPSANGDLTAFGAPSPNALPAASASARVGAAVYALLIIYASWYPLSGWHNKGLRPWAFLLAPLPHYWTWFDLLTNVGAYVPLGALLVLALYPRLRGVAAVGVALCSGVLLSACMEAGQTFLPTRVSSNLDLLPNAAGTLLGALLGALLSRPFLEQSRLLQRRNAWLVPEASRGLIVLTLWPLAQLYPQGYLFGHGEILPILSTWLSNWLDVPVDLAKMITSEEPLTAEEYWLSETIITASGLTGAALALLCLLRRQAPKLVLLLVLVSSALLAKTLASALLFAPENALSWLTPGAKGGVLVGMMMLSGLFFTPSTVQRRVAAFCLVTGLLVTNLVPSNPYFVSTLQAWLQGKFLNFNGAAQFLSLAWPFLALWFLLHPSHRRRHRN